MLRAWKISERLAAEVSTRVRDYVAKVPVDFPYYPSILWMLEGTVLDGKKPVTTIPAGYSLGIIRQDELRHFIAIEDKTFGYIAFEPSKDDLASTRRVIDRDGDNVVVR